MGFSYWGQELVLLSGKEVNEIYFDGIENNMLSYNVQCSTQQRN